MITSEVPRPIQPSRDLRTMLTDSLLARSLAYLEEAEERRQTAFREQRWEEYGVAVRKHIREAFGPMPFGREGGGLNVRRVSAFEGVQWRLENVLFDSFPGWEVNASVFVPQGDGPFPAVVIPVGHSGKQFDNYQIPARGFAALGFVAVLFDPPGQASEKKPGNDHFSEGVRTFLTGHSSSRYFVLDALRCIDYLETREDVDLSCGVGMTGVSGGGHTTLFATLFDDRITCQGPSCCINRMADHPVGDLYSPCPESKWSGRLPAGVDELDVLLAGIPTPALYMAGRKDEVFQIDWSRGLAAEAAECYNMAGAADRFRFFEDESGHAYTLAQVREFVAWMNRWMLGEPERPVPELDPEDFPMLPYEQLQCHPAPEENIFTLNRVIARQQAAARPERRDSGQLRDAVAAVIGEPGTVDEWEESNRFQVWSQTSRELLATVEGLHVPATLMEPMPEYAREDRPWLLFIDDAGRQKALESWGPAAQLSRMIQRDEIPIHPSVFVPDLPGWGDTEPALVPYSMTGWGSMDRLTAYLSCTMGDGVLRIRTRVAASLIRHLLEHCEVDPARLIVVGRGLGGSVALMAAALCEGELGGVVTWDGLTSFQSLAEEEGYTWPAGAFLPDVLVHFDLPELMRGLPCPVAVLNPLDAAREPVDEVGLEEMVGPLPDSVILEPGCDSGRAIGVIGELLERVAG
jgi:dienelactone hydrolase